MTSIGPHHRSCGHSHGGSSKSHAQSSPLPGTDELDKLHLFLQAHFGDVSVPKRTAPEGEEDDLLVMEIKLDGVTANLDLISMVRAHSPGPYHRQSAHTPRRGSNASLRT